jgi:hypothetical protein
MSDYIKFNPEAAMDTIDKVLIAVIAFLLAGITGLISYEIAQRNVREQAVIRGYAQWKVRDDGTNVTFEWKK